MPMKEAVHRIILGRKDERITIDPGTTHNFTAAELKDLPKEAYRDPPQTRMARQPEPADDDDDGAVKLGTDDDDDNI